MANSMRNVVVISLNYFYSAGAAEEMQLSISHTKRWAWFIALLVVLSIGMSPRKATGQKPGGQKWALLIGVNDYENDEVSDLQYAVADVKATANELIKSGKFEADHVKVMTSDLQQRSSLYPSADNVIAQLELLAGNIEANDTFFIYFSGHGFQRPDGHFLATANANPSSTLTLKKSTISLDDLKEMLRSIKARQFVFVLDACRNDPLKGKGDGANRMSNALIKGSKDLVLAQRATENSTTAAGTAMLLACAEGQKAWEMPESGHGVFTYFMLQGLQGKAAEPNGEVTAYSLCTYVQEQVAKWSKANRPRDQWQTPEFKMEGGRIVLAKFDPPKPVEEMAPPPPPNKTLLRVVSAPPGAAVYVKGFDTGQVTPCDVELDLLATKVVVDVELQMDGYGKFLNKKFEVKKGLVNEVNANLQRTAPLPAPLPTPIAIPTPVFVPTPAPTPVVIPTPVPTPVIVPTPRPTPVVKPTPIVPTVKPTPIIPTVKPTPRPTPVIVPTPVVTPPPVRPTPTPVVVVPTPAPVVVVPTPMPVSPNAYQFAWKYLSGQRETDSFSMSADGNVLATTKGHNVVLWNGQTGQIRMFEHTADVRVVALAANGSTLAATNENGQVLMWDLTTASSPRSPVKSNALNTESPILALAFSPDGNTLAGGAQNGAIKLWNAQTKQVHNTSGSHGGAVTALAFSPDGNTLASGGDDKIVQLWNAQSGTLQKSLGAQNGAVTALSFAPAGRNLAIATKAQTQVLKGFTIKVKQLPSGFRDIQWIPNPKIAGTIANINLVDLDGRSVATFRNSVTPITTLQFSPDGRWLLSRRTDDRFYVIETQNPSNVGRLDKIKFS
jgi:uncharacterized caspase-like protein